MDEPFAACCLLRRCRHLREMARDVVSVVSMSDIYSLVEKRQESVYE